MTTRFSFHVTRHTSHVTSASSSIRPSSGLNSTCTGQSRGRGGDEGGRLVSYGGRLKRFSVTYAPQAAVRTQRMICDTPCKFAHIYRHMYIYIHIYIHMYIGRQHGAAALNALDFYLAGVLSSHGAPPPGGGGMAEGELVMEGRGASGTGGGWG